MALGMVERGAGPAVGEERTPNIAIAGVSFINRCSTVHPPLTGKPSAIRAMSPLYRFTAASMSRYRVVRRRSRAKPSHGNEPRMRLGMPSDVATSDFSVCARLDGRGAEDAEDAEAADELRRAFRSRRVRSFVYRFRRRGRF